MPSRKFALEEGGPKRLKISWGLLKREYTVWIDGKPLATDITHKMLRLGWSYTFKSGVSLRIIYKTALSSSGLDIYLNDKLLPDSVSHPSQRLKTAYVALYVIAVLNSVVGLGIILSNVPIGELFHVLLYRNALDFLPLEGVFLLFFGIMFAVIGSFAKRHSRTAMGLAIVVLILDALLDIAATNGNFLTFAIYFRLWIIYILVRGFNAAAELDTEATSRRSSKMIWRDIGLGAAGTILVLFVLTLIIFRGMPVDNPFDANLPPHSAPRASLTPYLTPPTRSTPTPTQVPPTSTPDPSIPPHEFIHFDELGRAILELIDDPADAKVFTFGVQTPNLKIVDAVQNKQIGNLTLDSRLLNACLDSTTHHLFVLSQSTFLTEIDPQSVTVIRHIHWQPDHSDQTLIFEKNDNYEETRFWCAPQGFYVYITKPTKMYFISRTGETHPILYNNSVQFCPLLDSTLQPVGYRIAGNVLVPSFVNNSEGTSFYFFCELLTSSPDRPSGAHIFVHTRLDNDQLVPLDYILLLPVLNINFNDPITLNMSSGYLAIGNKLFKAASPELLHEFDESIIAIDGIHKRVVTSSRVYDLDTYEVLVDLSGMLYNRTGRFFPLNNVYIRDDGNLLSIIAGVELLYIDINSWIAQNNPQS